MNVVQSVEIKKQGQKDDGTDWTMYGIVLEDGRKASGFELVRVGESVEITQKGKYLNYKKSNGAPRQGGPIAPTQESPVSRQNGKPDEAYWEARNAAIERQHSQEMALRFFALSGKVPNTKELSGMISWFQRDIRVSPIEDPSGPEVPF